MATERDFGQGLGLGGKVAIVTGASRGIGRAVAERLAESGVDVVINYLRDERAAFEVKASVESCGAKALIYKADVARAEEAKALVERALDYFGRVDLLVCNAGVWEGAPVEELGEALWDRAIEVNLRGTWAVCRAAIPAMRRAGFGRIIIVSSTAGQRGEAFYANYAASKGGQIALMKSLAAELGPDGINVNAVAPGWVLTEMTEGVFSNPEEKRRIEEGIPLRRVATADDIALPILFLCSAWARHINGEVLSINGGAVLCG